MPKTPFRESKTDPAGLLPAQMLADRRAGAAAAAVLLCPILSPGVRRAESTRCCARHSMLQTVNNTMDTMKQSPQNYGASQMQAFTKQLRCHHGRR